MSSKVKTYTVVKYALIIALLVSVSLQIIMDFGRPDFHGDENFFYDEITRFQTQGLWNSFADGTSHLFVMCSSALSMLVGSNLLGARLLNILLLPLALFIWFKLVRLAIAKPIVRDLAWLSFAYLLLISRSGYMFFIGINDPLMIVLALSAIFYIIKYIKTGKATDLILAAILSGMMMWVRSFSILIIAGVLAWMVLYALLQKPRLRSILHGGMFFLVIIIVALLVQIPSISEHGKLSFESKASPDMDWGARNWLTKLMRISSGSVFAYARPEWEQVYEYTDKYGAQSIPRGFIGQVKHDPKFMLDNFASNFFVRSPYVLIVSIGLLFLPLLDYLRKPEFWFSARNSTLLPFIMVFFSVSLGVSMVIINYLEHRWLFLPACSAIMLASVQLERYENAKLIMAFKYSQLIFLLGASSLSVISKVM